jgi:hypothetical protein
MQPQRPPSIFVLNLLQVIFTLVGAGLITGGYFAAPGSRTDDGLPLNYFLYGLGGFFILFPLLLFGIIRYAIKRTAARQAWLMQNGIKGKARVLNMQQTHVYINRIPQVVLHLQVTTNLGETFETNYKKAIPLQYYNIINPDVDLPVYIDPANRTKLFVDFQGAWKKMASNNSSS